MRKFNFLFCVYVALLISIIFAKDGNFVTKEQKNSGQEFIVSYRAKMQNDSLSGESYQISKALNPWMGSDRMSVKVVKICTIMIENATEEDQIQKMLKTHKESILECLYSSGVKIVDESITRNLEARSKTVFEILPRHIFVTMDNGMMEVKILERQ